MMLFRYRCFFTSEQNFCRKSAYLYKLSVLSLTSPCTFLHSPLTASYPLVQEPVVSLIELGRKTCGSSTRYYLTDDVVGFHYPLKLVFPFCSCY